MFLLRTSEYTYFVYRGRSLEFDKDKSLARRFTSKSRANLEKLGICLDFNVPKTHLIVEPEDGQETQNKDPVRKSVIVHLVAFGQHLSRVKDRIKNTKIN